MLGFHHTIPTNTKVPASHSSRKSSPTDILAKGTLAKKDAQACRYSIRSPEQNTKGIVKKEKTPVKERRAAAAVPIIITIEGPTKSKLAKIDTKENS